MTVPRNRRPNTTLLASMTAEGIGPCMAVEGAITRVVFEAYTERTLTPLFDRDKSQLWTTSPPTRASECTS